MLNSISAGAMTPVLGSLSIYRLFFRREDLLLGRFFSGTRVCAAERIRYMDVSEDSFMILFM